ncbi:helix-turn-helix domain-containing protein [Kordia jejudonensis]|uniref:helix-turn-helix domain-containing protein n=1 Tax=Kordia jejudonensis TaxID=1348245 RepID=UPI0006295A0F|nr:helix-turn-helix transcriptional regulator [Kordia jejudonensis]
MNIKEEKYLKKLGDRIQKLRIARGVDQNSFAEKHGISRTQLYMIENGKTNPRLMTLLKIADGLEVELSELLKNLKENNND